MTTATETPIETLIERTPGILGGRPRLAGSRVSIRQIGVHYTAGETPKQILDSYPHLDLARIYAGIAYYLANRTRIDAEIAKEEAFYRAGVAEAKRLRATARQVPGLRLYCDEDSLDKAVIAALRRQRWDVLTVTEAGMAGRSDDEHLVFALGVNRVVYTANVGDFARLHAEYAASAQVHAGVIGRTRQRMPIGEQARALLAIGAAFDAEAMTGRFVYLEEFVAQQYLGRGAEQAPGHIQTWFNTGGQIPHAHVQRSMRLFMEQVTPRL